MKYLLIYDVLSAGEVCTTAQLFETEEEAQSHANFFSEQITCVRLFKVAEELKIKWER